MEHLRSLENELATYSTRSFDPKEYNRAVAYWQMLSPETQALVGNTPLDELVTYQGGDDYVVVPALKEPLAEFLRASTYGYNFKYYVRAMQSLAELGLDGYRQDQIRAFENNKSSYMKYLTTAIEDAKAALERNRQFVIAYDAGQLPAVDDYSWLADGKMIADHWTAVCELGLQDYFGHRYGSLSDDEAHRLLAHPLANAKYGHSGMSASWVCCAMRDRASASSWEAYVQKYVDSYRAQLC